MVVEEKVCEKEDEQRKKKKTILVGIRVDRSGRDLLNWALAKVAEPGDQVIALHVCRNADPSLMENFSLDDYLDVYKGLCSLKQIDLTGQISHGSSVRRVLVREAKVSDATAVVLGVSRKKSAISSWVYVAKYCSKNLPSTTTILAIHSGKIVFERGLTNHSPGKQRDPRPSFCRHRFSRFKESHSSYEHSETTDDETPRTVQSIDDESRDCDSETPRTIQSIEGELGNGEDIKSDTFGLSHEDKEEVSSSSISFPDDTKYDRVCLDRLFKDEIFSSLVPSHLKSGSPKERSELVPGWPLLRCKTSLSRNNLKESEARQMSVVQWVMSLPNRTHVSTPESQTSVDSDKTETQSKRDSVDFDSPSNKNNVSVLGEIPREVELLVRKSSNNCKWFNHNELKNATSQFSSDNLIGKGGCSRVYKGFLPEGKHVAVKVLKVSKEAWKDFILEIDIISSLEHKNITPLIGVCIENNDLILVYDFYSKGSLEENLHDKKYKDGLSWEVRYKVALGVAEAISYLHNECTHAVIHRDIKSSNVLLSEDFEPQLSDFGLAMWAPTSSGQAHFDIVGTFGYLAPEYFMYGKVTDKIDVYSFGVLLLELLSGRKPISSESPKGQESLVMWAKPILQSGDISGILDPDLTGKFDEVEMQRMVVAVSLCIARTTRLRPEMNEIVKLLNGELDIEEMMNSHTNEAKENEEDLEEYETYPESSVESHLSLALLDVDNDTTSISSIEPNNRHSLDDYLKGRWSRSSSFD